MNIIKKTMHHEDKNILHDKGGEFVIDAYYIIYSMRGGYLLHLYIFM